MSDEATRVCGRCNRPLVARDRSEYTDRRAVLVGERGLCTCPRAGTAPTTTGRPPVQAVVGPAAARSPGGSTAGASRAD
jgi:hypothetical protein